MKFILMFSVISLSCISLLAQQTVSSGGGNATGNGTVSYTVGQVIYTTNTNIGSVTQGVQQPYEVSVITGLKESKDISLEIVVYPNPAKDFIKLKIENFEVENLKFQMYDINGSLLQDNEVIGRETNISMQDLFPATYFLRIVQGNKEIRTFKIIKN